MKKFNYIYLIRNIENGKGYVGTHETNNLDDKYFGSGSYIKNAIKKYGKDKFEKTDIEFFHTIQLALLNEKHYIDFYNTLYPAGYNLSSTGGFNSFVNGKHSEESKQKMSASRKGKTRIISEEHKEKLRKASKKWHETVGFSKETREKISIANTGKICTNESRENYKIGNKNKNLGVVHSEESYKQAGEKLKGKKRNEEFKIHVSMGAINSRKECEFCQKLIPLNVYNRCHGKKCKSNV